MGNRCQRKKQVQIDIIGTPVAGREYIVGSCKYRNEKIDIDELPQSQTALILKYPFRPRKLPAVQTWEIPSGNSYMGDSFQQFVRGNFPAKRELPEVFCRADAG